MGAPSGWDEPFGADVAREVFQRRLEGSFEFELLDGCSDDAWVLDKIRNHRPEMRFRLTYDGSLKSAGNSTRVKEKWDIRRHLQPQLAELWQVHPVLQGYKIGYPSRLRGRALIMSDPAPGELLAESRKVLEVPSNVGGQLFLPLIRSSLNLTCTLDILFMRKSPPGSVFTGGHGGDIDNRLKTLFDGLKMPKEKGELTGVGTDPLESPFHCLLEDDRLVSSIAVRSDRLLTRPGAPPDQVRLIIDVIISPTKMDENNSGFLAD